VDNIKRQAFVELSGLNKLKKTQSQDKEVDFNTTK